MFCVPSPSNQCAKAGGKVAILASIGDGMAQYVNNGSSNAFFDEEASTEDWLKKNVMIQPAFLTIKWGREFDPTALNVLKRAALANCSLTQRFVCLTDDPTGLDPEIETYPIPAFASYENCPRAGIWPKISLFHPDLKPVLDQVVFLDIDTVIAGSLDELFDDPGADLVMLSCGRRWKDMDTNVSEQPATGVMAYRIGENVDIFQSFAADPADATARFVLEQQFVGHVAKSVRYFPIEWIESFKYHLRRPHLVDLILPPKAPKPHTKLVAFHGFPRPSAVALDGQRWARAPRSGARRPRWLKTYWNDHSDA